MKKTIIRSHTEHTGMEFAGIHKIIVYFLLKLFNKSILILSIILLFIICASLTTKKRDALVFSKVIFFSTKNWTTQSVLNKENQSFWFDLDKFPEVNYSDLNKLRDYYITRECDKKFIGGHGEGPGWVTTNCRDVSHMINWERKIRSLYISDPDLVVELFQETNFEGRSYMIWGRGGFDLTTVGWGDRARSFKIYFR